MRIFSASPPAVDEPTFAGESERLHSRVLPRIRRRIRSRADRHSRPDPTPDPAAILLRDRSIIRATLGLPVDVPLYGVVGPLSQAAGPDRLWRAWAAVRRRNVDAQLLVLADGPVPGLPGIRTLGPIPDTPAYLDACDAVLVLPRACGLPPSAAEAAGRGVPLVVSQEVARGDRAFADSVDGWVVDGDHPGQIAEILLARRVGTAQWIDGATAGVGVGPPPSGRAS